MVRRNRKGIEVKDGLEGFYDVHKVIPGEIDQFKVVHYSRYYEWISACLLNLFEHVQINVFNKESDFEIRVAKVQATYLKSARMNDHVTVKVQRIVILKKHIQVYFRLMNRADEMLMRANLVVAFIDTAGCLTDIPNDVVDKLVNISNKEDE